MTGVSKSFAGVQALDGVDFHIMPGEVVCLAGENGSGKSTLIKSLAGAQGIDRGTIEFNGQRMVRPNPLEAVRAGVQIIYQDFSLFPNLGVAENIAFSRRLAEGSRWVSTKAIRAVAREALDRLGVDIPLGARVESLPVASKQLVAIARAISNEARLIVMDEPTTALTEREVQRLLDIIRRLKARGIAVLFVSHKLREVFAVCERVMVLRNGRVVAGGPVEEFDLSSLSTHMTGRELDGERPVDPATVRDDVILEASGLTRPGEFGDISFALSAGEVLGITGRLGSGRTELAEALFGIRPASAGTIRVGGRDVSIRSIEDAMALGIAYVPEDRLSEGLFLPQSIARNIAVSSLDRLGEGPRLASARVREDAGEWVRRLAIATPDPSLPVQSLSGGNQQRVVLARWLATSPRILILNGPTVGVDVGSKADIHETVNALAADGLGVIVISDDLPEVLTACHRTLVMRNGRVTDEVPYGTMDEGELAGLLSADDAPAADAASSATSARQAA